MNNQNKKQYTRHSLNVKYYAVKMYKSSSNWTIEEVCNRYKISSSSLMRWVKKYNDNNGNRNSLKNESSKPKSKHPKAHSDEEIKNISNLLRRTPNITLTDLWIKLTLNYNYKRPQSSLYRYLRTNKIRYYKDSDRKKKIKANKRKGKYHSAKNYAQKLQVDVKYIPNHCFIHNSLDKDKPIYKFYEYTSVCEASLVKFSYAYSEISINNSIDFINKAIKFYGYIPEIIQTDNGIEFTFSNYKTLNKIHGFTEYLKKINVKQVLVKPQSPYLQAHVERSNRFSSERFYKDLKFYNLEDLNKQLGNYVKNKYNNRPFLTLDLKSPNQIKAELIKAEKVSKRELKSIKELDEKAD